MDFDLHVEDIYMAIYKIIYTEPSRKRTATYLLSDLMYRFNHTKSNLLKTYIL